jgi:hypothetical protein
MLVAMALLAVTRVNGARPLEGELPLFARITGLVPYEARLRLASPPPIILARGLALEQAQRFLAELRDHGHGAVAVDEAMLPRAEQSPHPHELELRADAFVGIDRGQRHVILLSDVLAVVRAVEVIEEVRTSEKVDRKLALGRAVLTGGLMRSKEVRSSATDVQTDAERTLYVFRRVSADPMVLRERTLRYGGLGELRGRTEHESFDRLAAWLRSNTKEAFHDDRLCAHKRRATLQGIHGTARDQVALSSGAQETALAAFLLVHAHLHGQL